MNLDYEQQHAEVILSVIPPIDGLKGYRLDYRRARDGEEAWSPSDRCWVPAGNTFRQPTYNTFIRVPIEQCLEDDQIPHLLPKHLRMVQCTAWDQTEEESTIAFLCQVISGFQGSPKSFFAYDAASRTSREYPHCRIMRSSLLRSFDRLSPEAQNEALADCPILGKFVLRS